MSQSQITAITELDKSHYKTKVYSGGHFIYSDEPEDVGGTDEGMSPAALLLELFLNNLLNILFSFL